MLGRTSCVAHTDAALQPLQDSGFPTDGYETPFNAAQFVFIYNKAHIPEPTLPPQTIPELVTWIQNNPGKFKFSDSTTDFLASATVRHFFYHFAGEGLGGGASWADFTGEFNEQLYLTRSPAVWAALNELEPFLHGYDAANTDNPCAACYPEDHETVSSLYADGTITFEVSYDRNAAANKIQAGLWPETSQAYVLSSGTLANTNFVAIPKNAPNKPGALVAANVISSGAAMLQRARPHVWGALQLFDPAKLSEKQRDMFDLSKCTPFAYACVVVKRVAFFCLKTGQCFLARSRGFQLSLRPTRYSRARALTTP